MEFQQRTSRRDDEPDEPDQPPTPAPAPAAAQDLGSILDAIDEVLESDAQTFVRNFVQKGGQ